MVTIPRIIITPGEPAGIGPDIVLKMAKKSWRNAELIVVTDPDLLKKRAKEYGLDIKIKKANLKSPPKPHVRGVLNVLPIPLKAKVTPGQCNPENASFVIACLEKAVDLCLRNIADALVTGPVNKSIINMSGIPFTGHTEFLSTKTLAKNVLMLFVVDTLKVATLTTHIPLAKVPSAITVDNIIQTSRLLHHELQRLFHIKKPKILVSGLNPHAGENGYLGREEIDIITPAIQFLQNEKIHIEGPLPADTIFTEKYIKYSDAILAMYHDQALPVVKHFGFHRAVNVTLGLPIIRTSVDHGTAEDIAGTNRADPGSLIHAIQLAIQLAEAK
jgi:4-hydroxythreonine-4-phosphate dehydrogenase